MLVMKLFELYIYERTRENLYLRISWSVYDGVISTLNKLYSYEKFTYSQQYLYDSINYKANNVVS